MYLGKLKYDWEIAAELRRDIRAFSGLELDRSHLDYEWLNPTFDPEADDGRPKREPRTMFEAM